MWVLYGVCERKCVCVCMKELLFVLYAGAKRGILFLFINTFYFHFMCIYKNVYHNVCTCVYDWKL